MNNLITPIYPRDTDEEIYLKTMLRDLQVAYEKEYQLEAKPIIDRLMRIQEYKTPIGIILPKDLIDESRLPECLK